MGRCNIIVDSRGQQHPLDSHESFERRISDYVIGRNPIQLVTPSEIARGREQTLEVLRSVFRKRGSRPIDIVGRWGSKLSDTQVEQLRDRLVSLKDAHAG
jgi:hypothetical protein